MSINPYTSDFLRWSGMNWPRVGTCMHLIGERKVNVFFPRILMKLWLIKTVVFHSREFWWTNSHRAKFLSFQNLCTLLDCFLMIHRRERLTINFQDWITDSQSILISRWADFDLRDVNSAACCLISLDADTETLILFDWLCVGVFTGWFTTMMTGTWVMLLLWCLFEGQT